jgi:hypothetical protein
VPRGLDQQAADVAVAGPGDRALAAGRPGGVLGRGEPDVGGDAGPGEPVQVADLDGQGESGQGAHAAQAAQPAYDRALLPGNPRTCVSGAPDRNPRRSSTTGQPAGATEVPTWSTRSAASMNDVDTDQRRHTLTDSEERRATPRNKPTSRASTHTG